MSVDLAGSTAFKMKEGTDGTVQGWLLIFKSFYTRFPEEFAKACSGLPTPTLWKALGDELVFYVRLEQSENAAKYLLAFCQATQSYNASFAQKKLALRLKNTAWIAGFPVGNAELKIKDPSREGSVRVDFVGPYMDIGFRLTKLATPEKFILSVDLALIVLYKTTQLKCHFDGETKLKGVLGEVSYPIIWLQVGDQGSGIAQKLRVPPTPNDLRWYCEQYISNTGGALMTPFVLGDRDFNTKPPDWKSKYESACKLLSADDEPVADLSTHSQPVATGAVVEFKKKRNELLAMAQTYSKRPRGRAKTKGA